MRNVYYLNMYNINIIGTTNKNRKEHITHWVSLRTSREANC